MQRLDILFEATARDIDCLRLNRENVPAEELAGGYKKSLEALQARIIRQLGEMIVILCFDIFLPCWILRQTGQIWRAF